MKTTCQITKLISILLAGSILFTSCVSTTMIQSNPSGAKLYLNGEYAGETPYTHRDSKIVGSTTTVRLEKVGYETFNGALSRNEEADIGAIIGGVFFLVPFLWTMKYKPSRTYELKPTSEISKPKTKETLTIKSKTEQLRELKELLDEGVITQEEFEKEKEKVLEGK